jgi:hypothetical protein
MSQNRLADLVQSALSRSLTGIPPGYTHTVAGPYLIELAFGLGMS